METDSIDKLSRANDPLTTADAYRAMLRLLKYYFEVDHEYSVGAMLGELASGVWADGTPGDPAAWSMWLASVDGGNPGGEDHA
jgi:hypothetical protein